MENNLPVKLFSKRKEIDERSVEGGGGGEPPKFILHGQELKQRAIEFIDVLEETESILKTRKRERDFIPIIVKAQINTDAIAKTHRKEISKLFSAPNDESGIIGYTQNSELLIKFNNANSAKVVIDKLSDYERFAHSISSLEKMDNFKAIINIPESINIPLKIKLINYNNYEMDKAIGRIFENICNSNVHIKKVSKTEYAEGLTIYKLNTDSFDELEDIKDFEGVFSIEPMPRYDLTLDMLDEDSIIPIKQPQNDKEYPVLGILDTGIESIPHLKPWLLNKKHLSYPESYIDRSHATFVSGVVLYGDELEGKTYTGLDGCKLFDATVFPDTKKESIDQDDLINNIREAIKNNCDEVKIWNLSLGTRDEADLDNFSDFGMALDDIQDKYGVLICKSAGNCTNFISGAPKSRISKSADSVRSLVVGSVAHEKSIHDLAEINNASPFSRIGRGPAQIIKPDIVHYGGNAGVANGRLIKNGVKSFSVHGAVVKDCGTSFSTPRVSAIVAGVDHQLSEEFNPLLLKGLLVHSSGYHKELNLPIQEKLKQVGFGLPKAIPEIIYNAPNEITLILQDTLEKGSFIEILDFPFPQELVDDGYYYGEIIVTVVQNSILEPTQGEEYCQSDIQVSFGSYDARKARDTSKPLIKNPIGMDGNINVLQQTLYSKRATAQCSLPFGQRERLLVQYGNKFYPIKKYALDLNEMTPTNKENYLKHPKKWFMKIEGLYRDFTEKKAINEGLALSQDFCVLVTIKDPKKVVNVYDKATQLLDQFSFIHSNIRLRNDVQVKVSNRK